MNTTIDTLSPDLFAIRISDERHLGVLISTSESNRSAKRFAEDGIASGYVVRGDSIEEWKASGLREIDGNIYLYGPYLPGRTIESITDHEPGTALSYLIRLARALRTINAHSLDLPPVQTNGVLFLDDGGTLILPPVILERLRSIQVDKDRIRTFELYNHPDLTGEAATVFSLGVIAYRIAAGEYPYQADDDMELRNLMRSYTPLSPRQRKPEVRKEVSDLVSKSIGRDSEHPTLDEFCEKLQQFSKEGLFAPIDDAERNQIIEQTARIQARRDKTFARRKFLKKNGRILVWTAVGVAIVASIAFSIISNLTKPRITRGMEPLEVVELFYSSITDLDHEAVEDCLGKDVGRLEITEATNLFVISRMRLGNEGITGLVNPEFWHKSNEGQVADTSSVYGIDNLSITEVSEHVYRADYIKWEQVLEESVQYRIPHANAVARLRRDVLTVEFDGTYWLITDIDRREDRYLTKSEYEDYLKAASGSQN